MLWLLAMSIAVMLLGELRGCFSSVVAQKRYRPGPLHVCFLWQTALLGS